MTRKETEQMVRRTVRETIPDREALWARIEADLPDEQQIAPEPPRIVRRRTYRMIAAAACFVLVIGGVGVVASMTGRNFEDSPMHSAIQLNKNEKTAMENADKTNDAVMEDYDLAADDIQAEEGDADDLNTAAYSMEQEQEAAGAAQPDREDAAESKELEISYEAVNFGEPFCIEDVAALAELVESSLAADSGLCLQEPGIDPETAGNEGLCVTLHVNGRKVYLSMVDGVNRMIEVRDGNVRTYYLPASVEEFLDALMTD